MLLWGVVVGIGTGMTALVLGATVAARAGFGAARARWSGFSPRVSATGELVFLPLASPTSPSEWAGVVALALICADARALWRSAVLPW